MLKKIVFLISLLVFPFVVHAASIQLPKTGQTFCYNESGQVIFCAGTGQDGEEQAGVAWPSPRFSDNSDGTVTDNLTGLIWLKNGNCFDIMNWIEALARIKTLHNGECGLIDNSAEGAWRLPNSLELASLTDLSRKSPAIPVGNPFTDIQTGGYWTSTSDAGYTPDAFVVMLDDGSVRKDQKSVGYFVLPVRGGE